MADEMFAHLDWAVLAHGEAGTGKELIAPANHQASPPRQHHFVALNCTEIPEALLESEQFVANGPQEDGQERLQSLQDWICELLIKKQNLRESLAAATTN
jgi:DNA-binding NtrC family response regulator